MSEKRPKYTGAAFDSQRKDYYEAATGFYNVGFFAALSVWVYLDILIIEKVIGWF